jgi:selenophosphate synthetase-related protein
MMGVVHPHDVRTLRTWIGLLYVLVNTNRYSVFAAFATVPKSCDVDLKSWAYWFASTVGAQATQINAA